MASGATVRRRLHHGVHRDCLVLASSVALPACARGCSFCHTIPGVRGADGTVGPPLTQFGRRVYIAGSLVNNQENLVYWIQEPDEVEPGTAMPDLGVSEEDALNMSAYLLGLE